MTPIGLACKSCSEVVQCACDATNKCTTSYVATCASGKVCKNGNCVSGNTCIPSVQPKFICSSTGVFPDPYDCQAYHFCVRPTPSTDIADTPATCPDDDNGQKYGYNPITTFCSTKLVNNKCSGMPIPPCKRRLDTGMVGNNPYLYYLCLNVTEGGKQTDALYNYQFACQYGTKFNPATSDCR
ncbi:hypothetical protein RI129_010023 [Pyrocoelia pectoralis]|uniref:Chitin-binding type-2 domain-containing protein n=1 Tax=Pyrocoelia pectoralis TaxID=417401 RepID=A0AAN7VAF7_9COLE